LEAKNVARGGGAQMARPDDPEKEKEKESKKVAAVARLLHLAGFAFCPQSLAHNWKNGVLVDHPDIIFPRGFGWRKWIYRPPTVE
jgi:hypothetical protein